MGISAGASMPSLTADPVTSSTVMVTSSPRQICSPDLRVITSMGDRFPRLSSACCRYRHSRAGRLHLIQLHLGEEGMPDRVAACVVQDLTALTRARVDHERADEVDGEVVERLGGAHDADDVGIARLAEAEARGLVVRDLDLVVAEEQPRRGDRDRNL